MRRARLRVVAGVVIGLGFVSPLLIAPQPAEAVPVHFDSFTFEEAPLIHLTVEGQALPNCGPTVTPRSICAFPLLRPAPPPEGTPFHAEFTLGETVFFTHDQVLITPPPPPITLGVPLSLIAPFPPDCCHTLRSFTMLFSVMSAFSMARRLSPPPNPRRSSSSAPRRRASGFSRGAVARPLLCLSKRCAPGREIRGRHPSTGAPGAPDFAPSRDCAPSVPRTRTGRAE